MPGGSHSVYVSHAAHELAQLTTQRIVLERCPVTAQGATHVLLEAQSEAIDRVARPVTAVVMSTDVEHSTVTLQLNPDAAGAVLPGERVLLQRELTEDSGPGTALQPQSDENEG